MFRAIEFGKLDDEGATYLRSRWTVVIVQTLQAGQDGTRDKEKRISYLAAITG